jgi:hypothetical protein
MRSVLSFICACTLIAAAFQAGCTGAQPAGQPSASTPVPGSMTTITAAGRTYPVYLAFPASPGTHPGLVLIHSFNGLEQGYKDM